MSKGYEENYFFVFRDDAVTYNELETRVQLRKRRVQGFGHQVKTPYRVAPYDMRFELFGVLPINRGGRLKTF